jgi:uncharacterized protein YecE (DUF72 family)
MMNCLRAGGEPVVPKLNFATHGGSECSLDELLKVPQTVSGFRRLRQDLETTGSERQLSKLRNRVALIQFYRAYTDAQANPHTFLSEAGSVEASVENPNAKKKRKRKPLNVQSRRGKRRATAVLDRIVDTIFSDSVPRHESINTARMPKNARRTEVRQAAKRAIRNWTAKGQAMVKAGHSVWLGNSTVGAGRLV